eukprot:6885361-Prymnesium_polylepis.1
MPIWSAWLADDHLDDAKTAEHLASQELQRTFLRVPTLHSYRLAEGASCVVALPPKGHRWVGWRSRFREAGWPGVYIPAFGAH